VVSSIASKCRFTLIELPVVVAIIAILAVCMSNLRQMGTE
jgi:prepilin-type N-terminal cleavage/methylation domain-containing protein